MSTYLNKTRASLYIADDALETAIANLSKHISQHPEDQSAQQLHGMLQSMRADFMVAYLSIVPERDHACT